MNVAPGVRFGIAVPQIFTDSHVEAGPLKDFLKRVETVGYHSAWVQEQILGVAPSLEPLALLAYAAACTRTLRLGSAVLLLPLRNPVQLAKSLSTIDHLAAGRLIVGVALGGDPSVYPSFGLRAERRARRFAESVAVIQKLWTEDRVSYDGTWFRLRDVTMAPKPVQKPHPPIWIGAHAPSALVRAVRIGDGWIGAGASSLDRFRDEVQTIRRLLCAANRDPNAFEIAKRVYIGVDHNKARVADRLTRWFGQYYGRPELARQVAVYGDVHECADGLQKIIAAGARLIILNPVFDELAQADALAGIILRQTTSASPQAGTVS